jgi:hypothetical protein
MENELIGRVARALLRAQVVGDGSDPDPVGDASDAEELWANPYMRRCLERDARAAIGAMREPTDHMERQGWHEFHSFGDGADSSEAGILWRAMIDAALAPTAP